MFTTLNIIEAVNGSTRTEVARFRAGPGEFMTLLAQHMLKAGEECGMTKAEYDPDEIVIRILRPVRE